MTDGSHSTRTLRRKAGGRAPEGVQVSVIEGPAVGQSVQGAKIVVGRSKSADLVIDDPTVSEFHLELKPHADGIAVQDVGSSNGTWLGTLRVQTSVLTEVQDLQIGQSVIRVSPATGEVAKEPERESFGRLRGQSKASKALFGLLDRVAKSDLSVLVEGPTGTGKELVARGLHEESARKDKPFQVLDCTAIPQTLAESILFGHQRGAFTGADEARPGVFEAADGGTVFVDEVGDLPLELQPKLLRVLEQRAVTRVGGGPSIPVSFRLVSATWRNLRQMVNEGRFRDDLYHRLTQVRVAIPSLDERPEDIELLVMHFLRTLPQHVVGARSISREAMDVLRRRDYPGNVRELRNSVERAAQMAEGPVIQPSDLVFDRILDRGRVGRESPLGEGDEVPEFKQAKQTVVDDFEAAYLIRLTKLANGSLRRAALIAGVQRHYLRSLFRKHSIQVKDAAEE